MSLKNNLLEILSELDLHKRNRSDLLQQYVQLRLDNSLKLYYKEVQNSLNFLSYKDSLSILKKVGDISDKT